MSYWGAVITIGFFYSPAFFVIAIYSVLPNSLWPTISGGLILTGFAAFAIAQSGYDSETIVISAVFIGPIFLFKSIIAILRHVKKDEQDLHWFIALLVGQAGPLFWLLELTNF